MINSSTTTKVMSSSSLSICQYCKKPSSGQSNPLCRAQLTINKKRAEQQQQQQQSRSNSDNNINNISVGINSGNPEIDKFIDSTKISSKYCGDSIEWINYNNTFKNIRPICNGKFSQIYSAELSNNDDDDNSSVILKVLKDSQNFGEQHLKEFRIHHLCQNTCAIPFYGLTKKPSNKGLDYAMVMKKVKYGDLRNFLQTVNNKNKNKKKCNTKFDLKDKITLLLEISKLLRSLHEMNVLHRDFQCKNIFVDENFKVYIGNFGLSCFEKDSKDEHQIVGVLPYIAPEVFRGNPYTKKSEIYSLSMIMWELISVEPPYENIIHDTALTLDILSGKRPDISNFKSGYIPNGYIDLMINCWDADPDKRPDSTILPEIFEMMLNTLKDSVNNETILFHEIPATSDNNYNKNNNYGRVHEEKKVIENENTNVQGIYSNVTGGLTNIGSLEFSEKVIMVLDSPIVSKTSVITTAQKCTINEKLKKPESSTSFSTVLASRHEGEWKEKYDKTQKYISEQIDDEKTKKGLIDCTDKYVNTKEVIVDTVTAIQSQSSTTPQTIETDTSTQKKAGSFDVINVKIVKELDVPFSNDLITSAQKITANDELKSGWETTLTLGYIQKLNNNPELEEKTTKMVTKENKDAAINIIKSTDTAEIIKEIISVQKEDGQIELSDAICKELDIPSTKTLVTTVQTYTKNEKLKKPESASWWSTAINLSYLKNVASEHEGEWRDKYNKAQEYLSAQIGDAETEKELLEAADKYVIDKTTHKVIEEREREVIDIKKGRDSGDSDDETVEDSDDDSVEDSDDESVDLDDFGEMDEIDKKYLTQKYDFTYLDLAELLRERERERAGTQ
ncbi:hypothetical protein Glove_228g112 [Diversispora epigaea]|uniref:Protein kinase domain-containing protein n=1 Tax=Diversispora epigaea TaxID=1348612 RepID=A0A397IDB8_9GLOM|nr:hypothetical protein Glove_228g112 [Diversispora epigaea]